MATIAKGLALVGMLAACQNEEANTLAPNPTATASDRNAKTASAPLLVKDGINVLEYSNQGRPKLWKEINLASNKYREFFYTTTTITSYESPVGGSIKAFPHTYTLDINGRCQESSAGGKVCNYEYDAQGRLIKCYIKGSPNERIEFTYNAVGDIGEVNFFNKYNKNETEVDYIYGNPAFEDKLPVNPEVLCQWSGVSKYLPVFGTFGSHLVKVTGEKTLPWNGSTIYTTNFNYTFNADGYVKSVTVSKPEGSSMASERKYLVPLVAQ